MNPSDQNEDGADQLRSALNARAGSVHVGDPEPGVKHRIGVRRRQRHRRIALGSGALALIVAAGVLVPVLADGRDHHGRTASPTTMTPDNAGVLKSQLVRDTRPAVPPSAVKSLVAANTQTAFDLYGQLGQTPGNVFFSPYSIETALTMAAAGARGQTLAQMLAVLHNQLPESQLQEATNALNLALLAPRPSEGGGQPLALEIANSAWGQSGFAVEPAYLDVLARDYGAALNTVDFADDAPGATRQINAWIDAHTNHKIPHLFASPLDPGTLLVLANAVHFKASWAQPFLTSATKPGPFTTTDGKTVTTSFLHGNVRGAYAAGRGWQAADLPYIGGASMTVIEPDAGTFSAFERTLDPATLGRIVGSLREAEVPLAMPKLQLKDQSDLIPALQRLGMTDGFRLGDFSGISRTHMLNISKVAHQATVTIDEQGTEAAAATGIGFTESAVTATPPLTLDHPYLFFIRDTKTGSILFMGRVTDPTQTSVQQP